jgi:hypothetical protein
MPPLFIIAASVFTLCIGIGIGCMYVKIQRRKDEEIIWDDSDKIYH